MEQIDLKVPTHTANCGYFKENFLYIPTSLFLKEDNKHNNVSNLEKAISEYDIAYYQKNIDSKFIITYFGFTAPIF